MSDFFKSTLGYLGGAAASIGQDNDFVGQYVELGEQKLHVKKLIAEGGFGLGFVAQDLKSGQDYALKCLLAIDSEKANVIIQEISYLKRLSGHVNVVQFIAAAGLSKEQSGHGQAEYLILTELCTGGQLVDVIKARQSPLPCDQVLQVFYQTCSAVHHLHRQKPPIIHRDLKVENLLISREGLIKLCDFGSATMTSYYPDHTWNANRRSTVEDELEKNTTPMYRAPEMLDLYQNYPINEQSDVWALGCVLFLLCFNVHPFEDSAKLRIINANYSIPATDTKYTVFHELIRLMLKIHPLERPNIVDILERLQDIAVSKNVSPKEPIAALVTAAASSSLLPGVPEQHAGSGIASGQRQIEDGARPSPASNVMTQSQSSGATQPGSFGLCSQLRDGAANLVKNVKDASAKVVESVQNSMNKGDLDFSYITGRLAVMSYPAEDVESAIKNHIDDVRAFLDARHPNAFAVYNLSNRSYRAIKFQNRVSECGWKPGKAPPLELLFSMCKNMYTWLRQSPTNVCVVHCLDGKAASATLATAFACFCRLFNNSSSAVKLLTSRRLPPEMTASQLRGFTVEDGDASLTLNTPVCGDVTIVVYHARSTFGGKVQGKVTSVKMFQLQLYTGFIDVNSKKLVFNRNELDHLSPTDVYPDGFSVTLEYCVSPKDTPFPASCPWKSFNPENLAPKILFSRKEEFLQVTSEFDDKSNRENRSDNASSSGHSYAQFDSDSKRQENSRSNESQSKPAPKASFFESLQWQDPSDGADHDDESSDDDRDRTSAMKVSQQLFQIGGSMDLFGSFDPFVDAGSSTKRTVVEPAVLKQKEETLDDDFLAFVESKPSNVGSGSNSSDFDLLGNRNMQNIPSSVELNMPRASSRPDVGSAGFGLAGDIPRVNSSQNMASSSPSLSGKPFGQTNGKPPPKSDPFGGLSNLMAGSFPNKTSRSGSNGGNSSSRNLAGGSANNPVGMGSTAPAWQSSPQRSATSNGGLGTQPQNAAPFGVAGPPRFQAPAQPTASAFSKPATGVHPSVIGSRSDRGLHKPFEPENSSNSRSAVIIGVSVSIIAAVVIIAAIVIFIRRSRHRKERTRSDEENPLLKIKDRTSEDIRARLKNNYSTLVRIVDPDYRLLLRLEEAGCITSLAKRHIIDTSSKAEMNQRLLDIISQGNERNLREFIRCLYEEDQKFAYSLLIGQVAHIIATISPANNREQRERLIVDRLNLLTDGLIGKDLRTVLDADPYDVEPVAELQRRLDQRQRLNQRLDQCLNRFEKHGIRIVHADTGSIGLFFIANSKLGIQHLHEIYFNQQLKFMMEEIFILISKNDDEDDLRVDNLRWDTSNYADCVQQFNLPILPILSHVYEMAEQNQVRSLPIDQFPDAIFEILLVHATGRLFVTINRMAPGRVEVYTLATMMAVSHLWWEALTYQKKRKNMKRLIKRSLKRVCHPFECRNQHVTSLHIKGVEQVRGVAVLNDKLYVACSGSNIIQVFDSRPPSSRREEIKIQSAIKIQGLEDASDITVCSKSSQLYIADSKQEAIWRVNLLSVEQTDKFITIQWQPYTLSVNSSRLLITPYKGESLYLYGDDGNELHHIELPDYMEALHAVETTHNTHIVSYINRFPRDTSHPYSVSEVDVNGRVIRTFNDDIYSIHFNLPSYLVLYNDHVLVADRYNERITLLKSDLQLKRILINELHGKQPTRMCLTSSRLLIVCYYGSTDIDVFKV